MKIILTILNFEYMGYLKSKSFRITTIIFVAVIILASCVPHFKGIIDDIANSGEKKSAALVLVDTTDNTNLEDILNPELLNDLGTDFIWELTDGKTTAQDLVEQGDFAAAIEFAGGNEYTLYGSSHDFGLYNIIFSLDIQLTEATRAMTLAALPSEVRAGAEQVLETSVEGKVTTVGAGGAEDNYWLSYIMLYMLFMMVMMYGQFVVSSVVTEKSTKAMEILITSAKPTYLMFGKVAGVGCAALTQFGLIILAAVVGLVINFGAWTANIPAVADAISNSSISPQFVVLFILFFVTGYFVYAFVYAALGSTVSKIEDASSVMTLPMLLITFSFVVSIVGMFNIDSIFVKVLSYIPFFSPLIMFARISMGEASYIEAIISLVILIVTIYLLSILAAKIYKVGVMMYGKPMKFKDLAKVITQKS